MYPVLLGLGGVADGRSRTLRLELGAMTARRSRARPEAQQGSWLRGLAKPKAAGRPTADTRVDLGGLVTVADEGWRGADPVQVALMEEAERYKADYVFFRAASATQPAVAEALVYVDDGQS